MNWSHLLSPKVKVALGIIGALLLALLVFLAGASVGARHARFMRGPERAGHGAFGIPFPPHGFTAGVHGIVGRVSAVGTSSLSVVARDGETVSVSYASTTRVVYDQGATTTLSLGDSVIIVGNPVDDRVDATLIRILR